MPVAPRRTAQRCAMGGRRALPVPSTRATVSALEADGRFSACVILIVGGQLVREPGGSIDAAWVATMAWVLRTVLMRRSEAWPSDDVGMVGAVAGREPGRPQDLHAQALRRSAGRTARGRGRLRRAPRETHGGLSPFAGYVRAGISAGHLLGEHSRTGATAEDPPCASSVSPAASRARREGSYAGDSQQASRPRLPPLVTARRVDEYHLKCAVHHAVHFAVHPGPVAGNELDVRETPRGPCC